MNKGLGLLFAAFGFFSIGWNLHGLYLDHAAKKEIRFNVGDCVSNGFFYKTVVAITHDEKSFVGQGHAYYQTQSIYHNSVGMIQKDEAWLLNEMSVVVDKSNCQREWLYELQFSNI